MDLPAFGGNGIAGIGIQKNQGTDIVFFERLENGGKLLLSCRLQLGGIIIGEIAPVDLHTGGAEARLR
ncbi:hypothetical protein D3C76_1752950 [compost metagenome]